MPPTLSCPGCRTELAFPNSLAGKPARCPRCKTIVTAPAAPPELPPGVPMADLVDARLKSAFPVASVADASASPSDGLAKAPRSPLSPPPPPPLFPRTPRPAPVRRSGLSPLALGLILGGGGVVLFIVAVVFVLVLIVARDRSRDRSESMAPQLPNVGVQRQLDAARAREREIAQALADAEAARQAAEIRAALAREALAREKALRDNRPRGVVPPGDLQNERRSPLPPSWRSGCELLVRRVGEREFTEDTKRYGVEVYRDDNSGKTVYISETGSVAVLSESKGARDKDVAPLWKNGMEIQVRKAGEKEFTKDSKAYSVEVYYDAINGSLMYISDAGNIAVVPYSSPPGESKDIAPTWLQGMELQARKAGEDDFNPDTARYGVEVYRDENNDTLIYIAQTGSIAVVGKQTRDKDDAFPWQYAMEVRVRRAGEPDFTEKTQKIGVEVFRDDNDGCAIYISQTGALGIMPGLSADKVEKNKAPEWKYGITMKARKAGEAEFGDDTKRYGLEVFKDGNTGNLIYITELGAVPVVK
jgi:hypothetical protein